MNKNNETNDASGVNECKTVKDFRPYTIVVDIGKPYDEEAADLDAIEEVLRGIHQKYIVEEECPHVDVFVYDSIDRDITESQAIQEIVSAIVDGE